MSDDEVKMLRRKVSLYRDLANARGVLLLFYRTGAPPNRRLEAALRTIDTVKIELADMGEDVH